MLNKIYVYNENIIQSKYAHTIKNIEYYINDNNCWICISHATDKDGYPKIRRNNKYLRLSRYIYKQKYGFIDNSKFVMHECDNPSCINPKHLKLGTHQENMDDRQNKNRQPYGENNGSSILTEIQVHEICKLLEEKKYTQKYIGSKYNVNNSTISNIVRGAAWKYISKKYNIKKRKIKNKYKSQVQKREIINLYLSGFLRTKIVKLGYPRTIVYRYLKC